MTVSIKYSGACMNTHLRLYNMSKQFLKTSTECCWKGMALCLYIVFISSVAHANFDDNDYELAIDEKRYQEAYNILVEKDDLKKTVPEKVLMMGLDVVIQVEAYEWPKDSLALQEDEVDPTVLSKVNKYYEASKKEFLAGKKESTKAILLHMLFLYPDYPKAVFFLEKGFVMPKGTYKVKDQVITLIKRSDNYFYGGNFLKSAQDLEILTVLEKENPLVYEKLGSVYYMMNEKQKAVDIWTTALFLSPENEKLDEMIQNTKKVILEEAEEGNPLDNAVADKVVIDDPQVMGVFKRQSEAFELMKELKTQGLTVAIAENDSGKWVVQVSRKELQERNQQQGSE
jgi:tetratricopeptide (TPR) repeat protein